MLCVCQSLPTSLLMFFSAQLKLHTFPDVKVTYLRHSDVPTKGGEVFMNVSSSVWEEVDVDDDRVQERDTLLSHFQVNTTTQRCLL